MSTSNVPHIRLLRLRQIITHISPTRRLFTDEYTVQNDSKDDTHDVILQAYSYRANLHVYDSDDYELPLLPNDQVVSILRDMNNALAKELLDGITSRKKYIQWIKLPPDRKLGPGEIRVLRFTYIDYTVEKKARLRDDIFSIPMFPHSTHVDAGSDYMTHILITPPEGFDIKLNSAKAIDGSGKELADADRFHKTIGAGIIDFNIPSTPKGVQFNAEYSILPDESEQALVEGFYLLITILAAFSFLVALGVFDLFPAFIPYVSKLKPGFTVASEGVLALCIGFIGFVTNPLTHRSKFYILFPMLLAVVSLIIES